MEVYWGIRSWWQWNLDCALRNNNQCFREIWCLHFCSEDGSSISSEAFVLCVRLHSVITKKTVILNFHCCKNHKWDLIYKSYDQCVVTSIEELFTVQMVSFSWVHYWVLQLCNPGSQLSGAAHLYITLLCTTKTCSRTWRVNTTNTKPVITYSSEIAPFISHLHNPSS